MSDTLVNLWGIFLENFWYLIVFGYGAIVGSFLNVLIYRMPLGISVSKPPSHCPRCNTLLRFWDNIPLFAFLLLGGKCRYCRAPISWRYFGVELLTACLWTALFHAADRSLFSWVDFLAQALFVSVLIAVIFIDLDHFIIPDELNWFGVALGVVRDVACLALAWRAGGTLLTAATDRYGFLGWFWLPRSIPGALAYGGAIYAVSFAGFIVYARADGESIAGVARRFFTLEEAPDSSGDVDPDTRAPDQAEPIDDEETEDVAVRLRFSPAFLALVAALVLVPVIGTWAILFLALPLAAFTLLSRRNGEPLPASAGRFFRSDDQDEPGTETEVFPSVSVAEAEEPPLLPGDERLKEMASLSGEPELSRKWLPGEAEAQLRAEADQFAIEAETGQHGGMGLGDVKLALAIGAMLGPGPALLSLFFATFAGALTGITLARIHGRSLRLALPFGPFMALGAILVMLYGPALIAWYLGTFLPAPPAPLPG
ncbi:MAG: A24 family peptidase [Cytophagales bacterium]|nr:A24 family peptidase [Armatimonadota bacterium]